MTLIETLEVTYVSEIIKCRIATIALRSDNILHIDIKGDDLFVLSNVHEAMVAAYKIGKGKKFANLITIAPDCTADHDARALSTSAEGSKYKVADAFVIHSLAQKMVANFYMKFHKPVTPTKFFTSADDAINWLQAFI